MISFVSILAGVFIGWRYPGYGPVAVGAAIWAVGYVTVSFVLGLWAERKSLSEAPAGAAQKLAVKAPLLWLKLVVFNFAWALTAGAAFVALR